MVHDTTIGDGTWYYYWRWYMVLLLTMVHGTTIDDGTWYYYRSWYMVLIVVIVLVQYMVVPMVVVLFHGGGADGII